MKFYASAGNSEPSDFVPTLPVLLAGSGRYWSFQPSRRLANATKLNKTDQKRPIETTYAGPENPCVGGSIPLPGTTEAQHLNHLRSFVVSSVISEPVNLG